jgi:CheY-like chemotaxis protein
MTMNLGRITSYTVETDPIFLKMAKKVLIVEDTLDIREALKMLIELEGYEVFVASDGREGCDLARQHHPSLIVMDLAMAGLSGIEATLLIRSDPTVSKIPIIAVTSYDDYYLEEAQQAGCDEVFTKSSFIRNFKPTLQKYLGQ